MARQRERFVPGLRKHLDERGFEMVEIRPQPAPPAATRLDPDHLSVANSYSRGDRELEKATAMLFPREIAQRGRMRDHTAAPFRRRVSV